MTTPRFPSEAARIAAEQAAQQVVQDPSVWASFLGPAVRGATAGIEKLAAPFEFLKQEALAPIVEGLTQSLPVRWEPGPGAFNFAWKPDAWVTPEGKFLPSAIRHNIATLPGPYAPYETSRRDPIYAAPGTRRYANIEKALYQKYQELGRPLSKTEVRQVGEELYKLPPFMRGTLEEFPYFLFPPAGVARGALAATRAGKMLGPAGARIAKGVEGAGRFQPTGTLTRQAPGVAAAARGALKVGEAALKPLDIAERAAMKAISVPARGLGRGVGAIAAPLGRKTADWGLLRQHTNYLRSEGTAAIKEGIPPEEVLKNANMAYAKTTTTGITDRFALTADNQLRENPKANVSAGAKVLGRLDEADIDLRRVEEAAADLATDAPAVPPPAGRRVAPPDNKILPETIGPKASSDPASSVVTDGLESSKWLNPIAMAKQTTTQMLDSFARLTTELSGKVPFVQRMNTGRAADSYIVFMNKFHNGQFLLTNLQENFWRSNVIVKGKIFEPGGKFDVVTKGRLAAGAKMKAPIFFANYLKNSLDPAVSQGGIKRLDIDRYVFAKRAGYLYDENDAWKQVDPLVPGRGPLRFLDYEFDEAGKLINEQGVLVDKEMIKRWTDVSEGSDLFKKYTQDQLDWLEDVARDTRDMMRMSRRRQFESKVISREFFEQYDMVDEEIAEMAANETDQIKQLWDNYQAATNAERRILQKAPATNARPDAIKRVNTLFERAGATDDAARAAARERIDALVIRYNKIMEKLEPTPRGRLIREPWYMPMSYIEAASTRSGLLRPGARGGPALSKGAWDEFAAIPIEGVEDIGYTAKPITGEIMLKHLMADEMRAAENDLLNDLFEMGLFEEHGLVNVSSKFTKTIVDDSHVYDTVSKVLRIDPGETTVGLGRIKGQLLIDDIKAGDKEIRVIVDKLVDEGILSKPVGNKNQYVIATGAKRPEPKYKFDEVDLPGYNEDMKSGVITFFREGERMVFAANEAGGAVSPTLWNTIYGRGALAVRGVGSRGFLKNTLAMSNGFFRGALTTFSPVFIVKNQFIDMFTGTMVAGLKVPHESLQRLAKSAANIAFKTEDRFEQIFTGSGGMLARVFDPTPDQYRKLSKAVTDSRHDAKIVKALEGPGRQAEIEKMIKDSAKEMMGIDNQTWKDSKYLAGIKVWKTVPAAGTLAEQSVRYVIARKSFRRGLRNRLGDKEGKAEWKRLMKLDQRDWEYELHTNWNKTGVGLIDSAEAKAASIAGVQSTLDFGRGGDMIRELNSYILFLNATMEGMKYPFRAMGINLLPKVKMRQYKVNETTNLIEEGPFKGLRVSHESVPKYQFLEPGKGMFRAGVGSPGKAFETGTAGAFRTDLGGPKSVALRVGAATSVYAFIQMSWNKQWEYDGIPLYYDVPEYVRNNSIIIMLPPPKNEDGEYIFDVTTKRPKLRYLVIPHRLRDWNMVFQPVTFMVDHLHNEVPVDLKTFAYNLYKEQSPLGEGIPVPELARYLYEVRTGQDVFRDQPVVGLGLRDELPPEQYDTRSSEASIRAAQAVYDTDLPDWIKNRISSPKRAEHFFTSATGGVGQEALTMADYLVRMLDSFREEEARPMEERVAEYREMDRTSRTEFVTNLDAKDYEQFQKEIRRPRLKLPFITKLMNAYSPGAADKDSDFTARGGGLAQMARRETEEAFPEISTKEIRDAAIISRQVNDKLRFEQQRLDGELDKWRKDNTTGIDPTKWIEERKKKIYKRMGMKMALAEVYDRSVHAMDDDARDAYYESLYTAAGQIKDTRQGTQLLIARYYAIEPEGDHPESADWVKFYQIRDEFLDKMRISSEAKGNNVYADFIRELQASMSETETKYDNARRYLSTYWNIGKDVSKLTSNPSAALQQQWDQYNALPNMAQKNAYVDANPHIDSLRKVRTTRRKMLIAQESAQRGFPYLDTLLVYWYGGRGYHEGETTRGQLFFNQLYGTTKSGFIPRNVTTAN